MSSTSSSTHGRGLHLVIPSTESRVPAANVTSPSSHNLGQNLAIPTPVPLDDSDPTHSHPLFRVLDDSDPTHSHGLFRVLDDSDPTHGRGLFRVPVSMSDGDPTHGRGLFRVPQAADSPSTPTVPKPSARVARRNSLFVSAEDRQRDVDHSLVGCAQHPVLPPTSDAEEPSTAELNGSFEGPSNGSQSSTAADERAL